MDEAGEQPGSPPPEADAPPEGERFRNPGELWRIEGSLSAVRSEVDQLKTLDDERIRERLAALERRLRDELAAILPDSLVSELHLLLDWSGRQGETPSELRIGLAQLEGWLDGVISGMGFVVVEPPSA